MSGALSGLSADAKKCQEARYELIQGICAQEEYDCYCPHQHSDPQRDAGLTPAYVYKLDSEHVMAADLVIADCSVPSLGVGIECERAEFAEIPVLLIAEHGRVVSRLVRGLPNV